MKFVDKNQAEEFLNTATNCRGSVWMISKYGNNYDVKQERHSVLKALLSPVGDSLELFCSNPKDNWRFFEFFRNNPEVLA